MTKSRSNATAPNAKGTLVVGTGTDASTTLAVASTAGWLLSVDSAETTGLKWAAPAAAGGMTLINTGGTTLTGASVSVSSIPATYNQLYGVVRNFKPATDNVHLRLRFNNDSGANRYRYISEWGNNYSNLNFDDTGLYLSQQQDDTNADGSVIFYVWDYANTTTWKFVNGLAMVNNATTSSNYNFMGTAGFYSQTGAINQVTLFPGSGNFTSGTFYLYGVK